MRIQNVQIRDCLGLNLSFKPNATGITTIGGRNGTGKSRVLLGLQMVLCGRMGCIWPENPVSKDKEEGGIAIRLVDCDCLMEPNHLDAVLNFETVDGELEESFGVMDSTGEYCPEPRTTLRRLRDTSDLEVQSPFNRRTYCHSKAIMKSLDSIEPREFRTYICSNATVLDSENFFKLDQWARSNNAQVIAEVHDDRKVDVFLE